MEDTRAIQGPGSADVEASVSKEDLVASDIENEKVFSYDGQKQYNQVQETVMVHVKNEQALDESPKGYEAGEGAMEEANYGVKCLSPNDYVKYESSSSDSHAGSYLSPHGTDGKLRCDICGLACVSLNVLLVHKRSHTGERPFHCIQCGASFTQKGNLLRHIKLHSGEKPFKCHMCSYACRRRDALSGHLRTHSVEKPYKCNFCGRSYKQRSSLEEHKERCHIYIQSKNEGECEEIQGSKTEMGTERALVLDRLASNVAKRKSSMPQKFVGGPAQALPREDQAGKNHSRAGGTTLALETLACISDAFSVQSSIGTAQSPPSKGEKRLCLDRSHSSNLIYTKEGELIQLGIHNPSLGFIGTDNMHHLIQSPQTARVPEIVPIISSAYPIPHTCSEISNDHKRAMAHSYTKFQSTQGPSASYNGKDSSDANINRHPNGELWGHRSLYSLGHLLVPRPYNRLSHHHPPLHLPQLYEALKSHLTVLPYEAMQVFNVENEPVGAYNCEHCHVLFLDYVMFTIHMGCHGFRDPFECNMCGHQSRDCYEFSSHIARGEHKMLFK